MIINWLEETLLYFRNKRVQKSIFTYRKILITLKNAKLVSQDPCIVSVACLLQNTFIQNQNIDQISLALDTIYSIYEDRNIRKAVRVCKFKLTGKVIEPISLDKIIKSFKSSYHIVHSQVVN